MDLLQEFLKENTDTKITVLRNSYNWVVVSLERRGVVREGGDSTFDKALLVAMEEFVKLGSWAEHWLKRFEEYKGG